jgi:hypothetical protein
VGKHSDDDWQIADENGKHNLGKLLGNTIAKSKKRNLCCFSQKEESII